MNLRLALPLALAACALVLPGCAQEKPAAAPDAKPGLAVSGARLSLPVVAGNPGAAYFTLANGGDKPASLAAVAITGAGKTEMHETRGGSMAPVASVAVAPGQTVAFEPGGLHVMAFDLAPDLKAGQSTEMTLTFADGDKLTTRLELTSPAASGHQGMAH